MTGAFFRPGVAWRMKGEGAVAGKKIGLKPPAGMRTAVLAQTVLAVLFLPAGAFFAWIAEGEAKPFALFFGLVWTAGCGFLFFRTAFIRQMFKEIQFALTVRNHNILFYCRFCFICSMIVLVLFLVLFFVLQLSACIFKLFKPRQIQLCFCSKTFKFLI